jgi:hypothetical protein
MFLCGVEVNANLRRRRNVRRFSRVFSKMAKTPYPGFWPPAVRGSILDQMLKIPPSIFEHLIEGCEVRQNVNQRAKSARRLGD